MVNLVTVKEPLGNKDERREIRDISPRIKTYEVLNEGTSLGNHFHTLTKEIFYLINGEIYFKLEDSRTGEKEEYNLSKGSLIEIPPFIAHRLFPKKGTIFLGILERDFDPSDFHEYIIE